MKNTLILGADNDYHARHMLNACNTHGLNAYLFDTSAYPAECSMSWDPQKQTGCIHLQGFEIPFSSIESIFWSTVGYSQTDFRHHEINNAIALSDATSVLKTLFMERSIRWCNSYDAIQFHKIKPRQLGLASRMGIHIPPTYIGNDVEHLRQFVSCFDDTIFKPVYGGAHCARVSKQQLSDAHLNRVLRISPVTIQKFIKGTNIRSYIMGSKVFSAEIKSDDLDYRNDEKARIVPMAIPEELAQKAVKLTTAFGMQWTAIDWRRSDDGEYFFLEANPSPMFVHFEQQTQHPITQTLLSILAP